MSTESLPLYKLVCNTNVAFISIKCYVVFLLFFRFGFSHVIRMLPRWCELPKSKDIPHSVFKS